MCRDDSGERARTGPCRRAGRPDALSPPSPMNRHDTALVIEVSASSLLARPNRQGPHLRPRGHPGVLGRECRGQGHRGVHAAERAGQRTRLRQARRLPRRHVVFRSFSTAPRSAPSRRRRDELNSTPARGLSASRRWSPGRRNLAGSFGGSAGGAAGFAFSALSAMSVR